MAREWGFRVDDVISFAEKVSPERPGWMWSVVASDVPALLPALRASRRPSS